LVVANPFVSTISVFLGKGDGSFPQMDFATGLFPISLVAADFNKDGKLYLAILNVISGSVSVLLGNGDGTFKAKTDFSTGSFPLSLASADLNGDGKPDLALRDDLANSGVVVVLLRNGDGTFGNPHSFSFVEGGAVGSDHSIAVGDFNLNGKPDVAALNGPGVVILLGNGDGIFGSSGRYRVLQPMQSLVRWSSALHKLEHEGWITAEWKTSEYGRRAKYYSLTRLGRRQLEKEADNWDRLSSAISRVIKLKEA
jgi:hypothetical protein